MAADKRTSPQRRGGGGKGGRGGGFPRWQAPYQRGGQRPEQRARPADSAPRRPPRAEPPPRPREPQAGPIADGSSGRWVVLQAGSLSELASALNARGVPPARLVHLAAAPATGEAAGSHAEWQALVWLT